MQLSARRIDQSTPHTAGLIENLWRKKELLEAGDPAHKQIRTALVVHGGGMRGAYAAGVITELERLGLTDVFDNVIGISSGAGNAAYFLAKQAYMTTGIYAENFTQRELTNPLRPKNVIDLTYLGEILSRHKPLDQAALRKARGDLYIGITDALTAQGKYVKANRSSKPGAIKLIQTSSSLPGISSPIEIKGRPYVDGVVGCKNPIQFAVEQLGATNVISIVNRPLREQNHVPRPKQIAGRILLRSYPAHFRKVYLERFLGSDEHATTVYSPEVQIGVLCPSKMPLSLLSHDVSLTRKVATEAIEQTRAALKRA